MLTTALIQAQDVVTRMGGHMGGGGFGWVFVVMSIFWIGFFVLLAIFIRRGLRHRAYAPGFGHYQGRSAESTLANRFANGDIDEQEYRARLEVLRIDRPQR